MSASASATRSPDLARLVANLRHLDLDGREVLEPPRRSRRDVARAERRAQLERPQAQRPRIRVRLARDRPLCCLHERARGLLRELLGRRALELGEELDGPIEVVRANLDELLARSLGEPLREARVVLRTRELRHARVRDLADQGVLEAVRRLARDRRARLAEQELALQEVVEQGLVLRDVGREVLERALPEDPPDDRAALEQRLRIGREVVDAGRDERLQRVRDTIGRAVAGAALDEHADRLLDEQRVPLGAVERFLRKRLGSLSGGARELAEQLLDELGALLLRERLELDRRRAHAPAAPTRSCVEQLGSGEAEDQDRRPHPVGDVLDEVEQWRLGPVDVLEEEDERLDVGDPLHDLACRPRDLLRAALAFERLHQPCCEPENVRHGLLGAALAELLERLLERIVVGDARGGLDHLAERPVGDALAVRQRAPHEHARSLDAVEELAREPALSHAGLAVDREEVRAAVPQAAVERVREELELRLSSDERRARAERTNRAVEHVHQPPGPKRPVDALQLERAGVLDDEACCREPVRRRADQDLARTGRALETRRQVDRLARRERRLGAVDDDLAGLDPDPGLRARGRRPLRASRALLARRAAHRPRVPAGRRTRP